MKKGLLRCRKLPCATALASPKLFANLKHSSHCRRGGLTLSGGGINFHFSCHGRVHNTQTTAITLSTILTTKSAWWRYFVWRLRRIWGIDLAPVSEFSQFNSVVHSFSRQVWKLEVAWELLVPHAWRSQGCYLEWGGGRWSRFEANWAKVASLCAQFLTSSSACGPTALLTVLRALQVNPVPNPDGYVPARLRRYQSEVPDYLISRMEAGPLLSPLKLPDLIVRDDSLRLNWKHRSDDWWRSDRIFLLFPGRIVLGGR